MRVYYIGENPDWIKKISEYLGTEIAAFSNPVKTILHINKHDRNENSPVYLFLESRNKEQDIQWLEATVSSNLKDAYLILFTDKIVKEYVPQYLQAGANEIVDLKTTAEDLQTTLALLPKLKQYNESKKNSYPRRFQLPLWKRIFDITFSSIALLCLSPLLILTVIAIRLESRGPIIYKSKREAITKDMFRDIINSNIQDVLKDYKYRVTDQQKEEKIKKLLNIYFNLNKYFDKMNNNFNQESDTFSMVQTTKDLIKGFQGLLNEENSHLEEGHDVEYAFALGQVVYYLVSQNESKNKTHSLLLPYMQLNNFNSIIQNVKNDCTKYAYKIAFSNKKFNKAFSEICGYMASTNFNNLKSYFLAGYFSKNMIYN